VAVRNPPHPHGWCAGGGKPAFIEPMRRWTRFLPPQHRQVERRRPWHRQKPPRPSFDKLANISGTYCAGGGGGTIVRSMAWYAPPTPRRAFSAHHGRISSGIGNDPDGEGGTRGATPAKPRPHLPWVHICCLPCLVLPPFAQKPLNSSTFQTMFNCTLNPMPLGSALCFSGDLARFLSTSRTQHNELFQLGWECPADSERAVPGRDCCCDGLFRQPLVP
jgi:hypothetical protein